MKKKHIIILIAVIVAVLILYTFLFINLFFSTTLHAIIFDNTEYQIYQCAKEGVLAELVFPETGKFPAFKDVKIQENFSSADEIIGQYTEKPFEKTWSVTGTVFAENAFGMKMRMRFCATVAYQNYGYVCKSIEFNP